MSALNDKVTQDMRDLMFTEWEIVDGQTVPATNDVTLKNGAVRLEAVYLYADLADSTLLQSVFTQTFAAKVMRMYLNGTCQIIRDGGGHIKSFDGDRVMGIYMGEGKRNNAADAALKISYLVSKIINPIIEERLAATKTTRKWEASHGVGVDIGEVLMVRAGVRNNPGGATYNDLISVGRAPNVAAKLSSFRDTMRGPIWITEDVFGGLQPKQRYPDGDLSKGEMWDLTRSVDVGPHTLDLYRTTWRRSL